MKAIADNGLPLKITAQWTDNDYHERRHGHNGEVLDEFDIVNVAGWLIRINGKKYPRGHTDGDGTPDWTYRYTAGHDEEGKQVAIKRALSEARLTIW
jgi:hypothetical protein